MTIIAWDGKTVAADRGVFYSSGIYRRDAQKLTNIGGEYISAMAGNPIMGKRILQWVLTRGHEEMPTFTQDDDTYLIMFDRGRPREAKQYVPENLPDSEIITPPWAWGLCKDIALGAMLAGASAKSAVQICIENSIYAVGPVEVMEITHKDNP